MRALAERQATPFVVCPESRRPRTQLAILRASGPQCGRERGLGRLSRPRHALDLFPGQEGGGQFDRVYP